jgi:hypothetical protein
MCYSFVDLGHVRPVQHSPELPCQFFYTYFTVPLLIAVSILLYHHLFDTRALFLLRIDTSIARLGPLGVSLNLLI